jgi:HAD superfamily hydrolase (TIGR01509 family)
MIKAIFLDFEGVVTNTPMLLHKDLFDKIKDQITLDEFNSRYRLAKIGKLSYKELMKGFEEYEEFVLSRIKFRPGTKKALDTFYSKKIPMFLASNHVDWLSAKEIEILDVEKYFVKIFFSNKMGVAKPSEEFYKEILAKCGIDLKKEEMVFVDDAKRNLLAAKKLGFITVYLPNGINEDTRNQLDYTADYEIKDLTELDKIISKLNK